ASCGGHTENSQVVFGEAAAYLRGVDDTWCDDSPYQHWDRSYTVQQLQKALESLGLPLEGQVVDVKAEQDDSGRVARLAVISEKGQQIVRGIDLRRVLGYRELRSTRFTIRIARTIPVYIETDETGSVLIPETIDINLEETLPIFAGIHIDHKIVLMDQRGQLSRHVPPGLMALNAKYKLPHAIQHGVVVLGMERKVTLTRFEFSEKKPGMVHHKVEKNMPVEFAFDGEGWGHGVGMCQWGCRGMAQQGMSYTQILAHYYPGTTLSVLTPSSR
ncbi:MAG TPA: SpoIID/LytB domain-containing protein, partial [Candidatus Xenobia bacterium]